MAQVNLFFAEVFEDLDQGARLSLKMLGASEPFKALCQGHLEVLKDSLGSLDTNSETFTQNFRDTQLGLVFWRQILELADQIELDPSEGK